MSLFNYQEFLNNIDRKAYHEGEWQWEEEGYIVTRTYHYSPPGCHDSCGVLLYVKDGKLERVEGDPLSPCTNGKLCVRCLNLPEAVNNATRLKYPMRRVGERGENKWERITWDQAYDEIEAQVRNIWETDGGNAIMVVHGTGRNINWQVPFFAKSAFKTPNIGTFGFTGFACYLPRVCGATAPFGDYVIADAAVGHADRYSHDEWTVPEVIVVWGNEPLASNPDGYIGHWLALCVQMGSKIISIDPRLTWWGVRAEYFLQLRPGTDAALACAWLNVIVSEELYDAEFISYWCMGFEEMAVSLTDKTPAWASKICGLDEEDIIGSARLYAQAECATIQWGLAFDQQMSAMALNLAVCDLMAITGNIDRPGGNVIVRNAFKINAGYAAGESELPPEWAAKKLSNAYALGMEGHDFISNASSDGILKALETGKPYPIKMMWIESSNTLSCPGMDAPRLYEAIKKIPFVVNADPFITPTSVACADILLPVAMSPERNSARVWWTPVRAMKKVCDYYEAKSDEQIILDMGHRLNPDLYGQWETDIDFINYLLQVAFGARAGLSGTGKLGTEFEGDYNQLVEEGGYRYWDWDSTYRKYEKGMLREDGAVGFGTPSGRIELTPLAYQVWGLSQTPFHVEPIESPVSTPDLFQEYPLVLTCGGRSFEFFHSEHRQLETMRELHPDPLVTINPKTAERYGISQGQWIWVENSRGRFKQRANVRNTVNETTVHAEHGWWFPEQDPQKLFGTFDSNPNNCTRAFETGQGGVGSSIKSMICKIYPVEEGDVLPGEQVLERGGFNVIVPGQA